MLEFLKHSSDYDVFWLIFSFDNFITVIKENLMLKKAISQMKIS